MDHRDYAYTLTEKAEKRAKTVDKNKKDIHNGFAAFMEKSRLTHQDVMEGNSRNDDFKHYRNFKILAKHQRNSMARENFRSNMDALKGKLY